MHRTIRYRRDPRLEGTFATRLTLGGKVIEAICRNVSRGGLFLESVDLPVGAEVEVELALDAVHSVRAVAEVRHRFDDEPKGVGLRFRDLSGEDQHVIRAFVEQVRPLEEPLAVAGWVGATAVLPT